MLTQYNKIPCHFLWARKRKKSITSATEKICIALTRELNRFPLENFQVVFVSSITFCVLLQAARPEGENTQEGCSTHRWHMWQTCCLMRAPVQAPQQNQVLWVCLLIPHESLAHPEFWLVLLPFLPGSLWQRAGILAPPKHNHICSTSAFLKELNSGRVGSRQALGVPAVPPLAASPYPVTLQCWSKEL